MSRRTRIAMVGKAEALDIEAGAAELEGLAMSLRWEWRWRVAADLDPVDDVGDEPGESAVAV